MSAKPTRLAQLELRALLLVNRANMRPVLGRVFAVASRLGDGVFWYVLMLLIPVLEPARGLRTSLLMLGTGLTCTVLYKLIKETTRRPRPCAQYGELFTTVEPLDEFSFPSGHTMHAVAFSMVAVTVYPALSWLVLPFTALVALSRVVLGLHYVSDVFVGALLGLVVSLVSLQLFGA
ncbi:MAG: phosphatase PAP2 family protein [Planctomycetota bacterium]|nr:phosphatase PAP2 family protein [Planctomycetota bacterium]